MIDEKKLIEDLMEQIPLAENVSIFKEIIESQPKVNADLADISMKRCVY